MFYLVFIYRYYLCLLWITLYLKNHEVLDYLMNYCIIHSPYHVKINFAAPLFKLLLTPQYFIRNDDLTFIASRWWGTAKKQRIRPNVSIFFVFFFSILFQYEILDIITRLRQSLYDSDWKPKFTRTTNYIYKHISIYSNVALRGSRQI